jgi:hypothetical protein
MDGNISKALWLGVSILLFIAVVTIGITVFSSMKDVSNAANEKIGARVQNLTDTQFDAYNGKEVTGDKVISAISEFSGESGDIIILVATLGANGGSAVNLDPSNNTVPSLSYFTQYVSKTSGTLSVKDKCVVLSVSSGNLLDKVSQNLQDAAKRDAENANLTGKYINPSGKFIAHLIYDANNKIRGIIAAQVN